VAAQSSGQSAGSGRCAMPVLDSLPAGQFAGSGCYAGSGQSAGSGRYAVQDSLPVLIEI